MTKIIKNAIRCNKCGDIIVSNSVHEFVACKCGTCSVDGEQYYLRRRALSQNDYTDLLELEDQKPYIEVVAALIWVEDKFLICQRPANKARGLLWEFVGGKVEQGETKVQALKRECQEELAITVEPHDIFTEVTHEYCDITVHLTLFNCTISRGQPQLLEHNNMKWITSAEIPNYEFCPADVEILKKFTQKI